MRITDDMPPPSSLLGEAVPANGYRDAFRIDLAHRVTLAEFVQAFYCAPLFRCERWILTLIGRPSRDVEVSELVQGRREDFAAWKQQARREDELLMRDFTGRTGSWFRAQALPDGGTRLWFGSGGWPRKDGGLGTGFNALTGAHRAYSRALLRGAAARLAARP